MKKKRNQRGRGRRDDSDDDDDFLDEENEDNLSVLAVQNPNLEGGAEANWDDGADVPKVTGSHRYPKLRRFDNVAGHKVCFFVNSNLQFKGNVFAWSAPYLDFL